MVKTPKFLRVFTVLDMIFTFGIETIPISKGKQYYAGLQSKNTYLSDPLFTAGKAFRQLIKNPVHFKNCFFIHVASWNFNAYYLV